MAKKRKPTTRQTLLVKNLAKGKTHKQAAIAAGYSPNNPDQSAHQAILGLQKTAPALLAAHGLNDDALIEKYLAPLMTAQETKFFPYTTAKGERKILTRVVEALGTRVQGLDMAFKIRGLYVREQENKGPEFTVIVIDGSQRPNWAAMKSARPAIEVPGLPESK